LDSFVYLFNFSGTFIGYGFQLAPSSHLPYRLISCPVIIHLPWPFDLFSIFYALSVRIYVICVHYLHLLEILYLLLAVRPVASIGFSSSFSLLRKSNALCFVSISPSHHPLICISQSLYCASMSRVSLYFLFDSIPRLPMHPCQAATSTFPANSRGLRSMPAGLYGAHRRLLTGASIRPRMPRRGLRAYSLSHASSTS